MAVPPFILHVEDSDLAERYFLIMLQCVAEDKGLSYEEVKKHVVHLDNRKDAIDFINEQKGNIAAVFTDDVIWKDDKRKEALFGGKDIIDLTKRIAPDALLALSCSSALPDAIEKDASVYNAGKDWIQETLKMRSDRSRIIKDIIAADERSFSGEVRDSDGVRDTVLAFSKAIDALGIVKNAEEKPERSALDIARRNEEKVGTDHAVKPDEPSEIAP